MDSAEVRRLRDRLDVAYERRDEDAVAEIARAADGLDGGDEVARTARYMLDRMAAPPAAPPPAETRQAVAAPSGLSGGMQTLVAVVSLVLLVGALVAIVAGVAIAVAVKDELGSAAAVGYVLGGLIAAAVLVSLVVLMHMGRRLLERPR